MVKYLKVLALLVAACMLLGVVLTGCAGKQEGTPATSAAPEKKVDGTAGGTQGKKLNIGYVASFLSNEFYQRAIEGMKKVAEKRNASINIADSNGEVAKQVNLMENFIGQKVDSSILFPSDPAANKGTVLKAKNAGIPTVVDGANVEGAVSMV